MTTQPTPYIGQNDVGDHVLVAGSVELLAIVDDGELGDPCVVLWDEAGEALDQVPLDHVGHDPGRRGPAAPSADNVRAVLAALHPALPAAVGHAMAYVHQEAAHSARDEGTLVDTVLREAAAVFAPMADELAADHPNLTTDQDELDLDLIVKLLREQGFPQAFVQQTGGGCATIQVPDPNYDGATEDERHLAIGGPGWFSGPGSSAGRASKAEFYIGADDDGESYPYTATEDDDEATLAKRLAKVATEQQEARR